jgi:hypothetical protein
LASGWWKESLVRKILGSFFLSPERASAVPEIVARHLTPWEVIDQYTARNRPVAIRAEYRAFVDFGDDHRECGILEARYQINLGFGINVVEVEHEWQPGATTPATTWIHAPVLDLDSVDVLPKVCHFFWLCLTASAFCFRQTRLYCR